MDDYTPLLDDLSAVLRRLHKALIEAEADNVGWIDSPYQLLYLAINDEHFGWLRCLSALMVEIDAQRHSSDPVSAEQAAAVRAAVESLVGPRPVTAAQFRQRYTTLLQQVPAAAMAHGDLRRSLAALPGESEG
jgi:hypothetical protein